jgi:predicted acetyltransferase
MSLFLKRLSPTDGSDIYALTQVIPKEENGFYNPANGLSIEEFPAWLKQQHEFSQGIGLPDCWMPQTIYWLYDGDRPAGMCKLRPILSEALLKNGGNIGYAIAPFARGKGYGKEQLRLVLQEAKKLGLKKSLSPPITATKPPSAWRWLTEASLKRCRKTNTISGSTYDH